MGNSIDNNNPGPSDGMEAGKQPPQAECETSKNLLVHAGQAEADKTSNPDLVQAFQFFIDKTISEAFKPLESRLIETVTNAMAKRGNTFATPADGPLPAMAGLPDSQVDDAGYQREIPDQLFNDINEIKGMLSAMQPKAGETDAAELNTKIEEILQKIDDALSAKASNITSEINSNVNEKYNGIPNAISDIIEQKFKEFEPAREEINELSAAFPRLEASVGAIAQKQVDEEGIKSLLEPIGHNSGKIPAIAEKLSALPDVIDNHLKAISDNALLNIEKSLKASAQGLGARLDGAIENMSSLCTKGFDKNQGQLADLKSYIETKNNEFINLNRGLSDKLENLHVELEKSRTEAATLSKELETSKAQEASLTAELEKSRTEAATLSKELETSKAQATSLTVELEKSRTEAATLSKDLETSKAQAANLTVELEKSRTEAATLSKELEKSRTEAATLSKELVTSKAQAASLTAELEKSRTEAATLSKELEKSRTEMATLFKDLETSEANLQKASEDLQSLRNGLAPYSGLRDALLGCEIFAEVARKHGINVPGDSGLLACARSIGESQDFVIEIYDTAKAYKEQHLEPLGQKEKNVYSELNSCYRHVWNVEWDIFANPGGASVQDDYTKQKFNALEAAHLRNPRERDRKYAQEVYVPFLRNKEQKILRVALVKAGND